MGKYLCDEVGMGLTSTTTSLFSSCMDRGLVDSDLQNFLDPWTESRSLSDENLGHGLTRILFLDEHIVF